MFCGIKSLARCAASSDEIVFLCSSSSSLDFLFLAVVGADDGFTVVGGFGLVTGTAGVFLIGSGFGAETVGCSTGAGALDGFFGSFFGATADSDITTSFLPEKA